METLIIVFERIASEGEMICFDCSYNFLYGKKFNILRFNIYGSIVRGIVQWQFKA
jgi:hypothetical protein